MTLHSLVSNVQPRRIYVFSGSVAYHIQQASAEEVSKRIDPDFKFELLQRTLGCLC